MLLTTGLVMLSAAALVSLTAATCGVMLAATRGVMLAAAGSLMLPASRRLMLPTTCMTGLTAGAALLESAFARFREAVHSRVTATAQRVLEQVTQPRVARAAQRVAEQIAESGIVTAAQRIAEIRIALRCRSGKVRELIHRQSISFKRRRPVGPSLPPCPPLTSGPRVQPIGTPALPRGAIQAADGNAKGPYQRRFRW
jgi:hypothetical protein